MTVPAAAAAAHVLDISFITRLLEIRKPGGNPELRSIGSVLMMSSFMKV